jgi:hypothetical protein
MIYWRLNLMMGQQSMKTMRSFRKEQKGGESHGQKEKRHTRLIQCLNGLKTVMMKSERLYSIN